MYDSEGVDNYLSVMEKEEPKIIIGKGSDGRVLIVVKYIKLDF
jgi:hypothetical protein